MLQIKQITTYNLPRYPQCGQYVCPPRSSVALVRDAAALVAMAALLDSCMWHTTGVPPPPEFVSEFNARQTIEKVFSSRGIALAADQLITVPGLNSDSLSLVVDGFNDSLQVGYEYVVDQDWVAFPSEVCDRLDSLNRTATPHITAIQAPWQAEDAEAYLRRVVEAFLDSLKSQGVI